MLGSFLPGLCLAMLQPLRMQRPVARMDASGALPLGDELRMARDAVTAAGGLLLELQRGPEPGASRARRSAAQHIELELSSEAAANSGHWLCEVTSCGLVVACLLRDGTPLLSAICDAQSAADSAGLDIAFATLDGGAWVQSGEGGARPAQLGAASRRSQVPRAKL